MNKTILTVCFVIGLLPLTNAQKETFKKRQVGVSLGWQSFSVLDQHASPLVYSTNTLFPKVGLSYSRQTERSAYSIEVAGASGQLLPKRFGARTYKATWSARDSFQYNVASPFYNLDIKGSYFRNISSLPTSDVQYWVGGTVNEAAYYGDAVANMPWIVNAVDLSPAFKVDYAPAA